MPKMRMTILNVDESTVTPLKFRGWLRNEVIDIQRTAQDKEDIIVVRLFISERLRFAITQPALDKMLKAVVDKHQNIYRVELQVSNKALSTEEILNEIDIAKGDLRSAVEEPEPADTKPPTFH